MPCARCVFRKLGDVDVKNIGAPRPLFCLRYPPTPVAILTQQGTQVTALSPVVTAEHECGEFTVDIALLPPDTTS